MGKPDAPTPPNPYATAAAATGTNVSTAVANAFLNNTNQSTPYGNLTYNQTGTYSWTDPTTGQAYSIPRFTATQDLSDTEQAIYNQNAATRYALAGVGSQAANNLSGLVTNPIQNALAGAPGGGQASWLSTPGPQTQIANAGPVQTQFGDAGNVATGYGTGGNIQMNVGPQDFSADRQQVQDALMARMNPQLQQQQQALQQQLADQGIRYGSDAYNNAMLTYSQQANDARWGAIQQAGAEQQRMQQEAIAQGQFANTAQAQANQQNAQAAAFQNAGQQQLYEQLLGRGSFANQAQAQQFQQNAAQGTFYNSAVAQQLQQNQAVFNAAQSQRNQYLQEQYAARNQGVNEITALMSGSQVSQPNWLNTPSSQIPTTDVAGLINQNFSQQQSNYNTQMNNWNSIMGGILGLGAGYLKSDEREKENVVHMGTVFAATPEGKTKPLAIKQWSYKDDPTSTLHLGPMAQEVERIDPSAVTTRKGVKYIKPQQVMGSILRAA